MAVKPVKIETIQVTEARDRLMMSLEAAILENALTAESASDFEMSYMTKLLIEGWCVFPKAARY